MICLTPKPSQNFFVYEKTVRSVIKQDLSLDFNLLITLYGAFWKKKTDATSHSNIGSLNIAIERKWNKMSEQFILKACKSFRMRVDTLIEKKWWP